MKIDAKNNSFQYLAFRLQSLFGLAKRTKPAELPIARSPNSANIFMPWHRYSLRSSDRHESAFAISKIELSRLEMTIKALLPQKNSFKGFISSHLQQENDRSSAKEIRRVIAAQKMLSLVMTTIREAKAVEAQHLSETRG